MKASIILKVVVAIVVVFFGVFSAFIAQSTSSSYSDLQLENVEALAQEGEPNYPQKCTRAKLTCWCFKTVNGYPQIVCQRVITVEEYEVTNMLMVCDHAVVTPCPIGSSCNY